MPIELLTDHPIAIDSPDHQHPYGTMQDNSRDREFNRRLFALWPGQKISVMDIGCSGGGFVKDCVDAGHFAVGLEGSDYSKIRKRAEWATIPDHLFTCDVTKPFTLLRDGKPERFHAITAWEVMEHFAEGDLSHVFANVRKHLRADGFFMGSVSFIPDVIKGVALHQTVKDREWWLAVFDREGFVMREDIHAKFHPHWVRGGIRDVGSFNVVLGMKAN